MSGLRLLAGAVSCVVLTAVIAGIVILDPPAIQRDRRLDAQRVRDLGRLAQEIDDHWSQRKALPPDLAKLATKPGSHLPVQDPVSGTAYEYRPGENDHYELCAVFAQETPEDARHYGYGRPADWQHGSGLSCFTRAASRKNSCND